MQKYRKFLVLLALSATALAVTGCGTAKNTAEKTADISAASAQADQEPSDMIFFNNTMYYDAGRTVFIQPDHTDGTIQSIAAAGQKPARNEEASFDCLGAPYCILADGAAAVLTDEASGAYELFLSDDTVEFQGVFKKKKELSDDTLKWLNFYYSLSESDRNALSMIPSEFARQIPSGSASVNETAVSGTAYLEALTQEELDATEALAQYYFTEEVTSFEGVDQIYPADSSDPQYHNSGIEDDYGPGNIIIYRVLTNLDRRDGNPFRYISIARKSKSDDWKIINSGF